LRAVAPAAVHRCRRSISSREYKPEDRVSAEASGAGAFRCGADQGASLKRRGRSRAAKLGRGYLIARRRERVDPHERFVAIASLRRFVLLEFID
jgi:hypothetical protein